jgi:hypothetical protein
MSVWQQMGVGVVLTVLCLGGWWRHVSGPERVSGLSKHGEKREDVKRVWYQIYRNCRDRAHDLSRDLDQSRDCAHEAFEKLARDASALT